MMDAHVFVVVALRGGGLTAYVARVGAVAAVDAHVVVKVVRTVESLPAHLT